MTEVPPESEVPPEREAQAPTTAFPALTPIVLDNGKTALRRSELQRLVEIGANNFIGLIDVQAAFRRGRFYGWRVLSYRGPGKLLSDDIVLSINRKPIERPGQFIRVWNGLHHQSQLTIEIDRARRRLRWVFPIVN